MLLSFSPMNSRRSCGGTSKNESRPRQRRSRAGERRQREILQRDPATTSNLAEDRRQPSFVPWWTAETARVRPPRQSTLRGEKIFRIQIASATETSIGPAKTAAARATLRSKL